MGDWVRVVVVDDDAEHAERGVRQLRRRLAEHEIDTRAVEGSAPAAAKGDAVTFTEIAVALGGTGGAVSILIAILREWLGRRAPQQRVTLTIGDDSIEVDGVLTDKHGELIDAFLRKHSAS
ncbi:hypothetical protein HPO96_34110 [Kribbella sandramycini]|uniref:Superfamily I DNA and RNA helicase n=1 Tax=Kribbella sandramycini TaxID=60450 RepID=A0A7Y4L6H0_9ACTN|nr:superfamily I DNA and RNA helicase [Kribbella sandramycini]NOL45295.1 hypothetical protein [Kribbella sandramycini]